MAEEEAARAAERAMQAALTQQQPPRLHDDSMEEGEVEAAAEPSSKGDVEGGKPTPANTSSDATERRRSKVAHRPSVYGLAVEVETSGTFPEPGSILGPFFCLGQLGKGTFSSIHKCIHLAYREGRQRPRLAAAKVELTDFAQSGVLESEATILEFLWRALPPASVPEYLGHYRSSIGQGQAAAALVMEYLPGSDMHQLREAVMTGRRSRRIDLDDAVMLAADVMLPLLQRMHDVGIVHRDVKPSNCVLRGQETSSSAPDFLLVDFGLSKSILVPEDSVQADTSHLWTGKDWLRPQHYTGRVCYRQERAKAEFRGTSMYASVKVHQLRDYCPRDDMYSLMYVFCDWVSGGLPWMSSAANRDRAACQAMKERVHYGVDGGEDETGLLLMGDEYHVARYRQEQRQAAGDTRPVTMPEPLAMSNDPRRVGLLRRIFEHLDGLAFWDRPDYDMIRSCLHSFTGTDQFRPPMVPRMQFHVPPPDIGRSNLLSANRSMPKNARPDDSDPLSDTVFDAIVETPSSPTTDPFAQLPLELRFRLAQMEFHASRPETVAPHLALRDWMKVTMPLLYGEWDTPAYEGRHRTSTDGMKRDLYLQLLKRCQAAAAAFDDFRRRECYYPEEPASKRRKMSLVNVSRALFGLSVAIEDETAKRAAAPNPNSRFRFGEL